MNKRSFSLFIVIFILSLFFVGMLNFLLDPYGRYGTDILNMDRVDPRSGIIRKLKSQPAPPELLLFGSSRVLRQKPEYSPQLHGLNVSLFGGAIEDHYCIMRYGIEELKFPIKWVVLGLEPELMVNTHPTDKMLTLNKDLGKWLIQEKKSALDFHFHQPKYIDEIASLLSINTLIDSGKLLFKFIIKKAGIKQADGSKQASVGKSNSMLETIVRESDSMEARLRQYKKLYAGQPALDKERLIYLTLFAEYAKKKNIQVILFKPGYSIPFWKSMAEIPAFLEIHRALDAETSKIQEKFHWKIIDFRPLTWKGEKIMFFDGVHPVKASARYMDTFIRKQIQNGF